MKKPERIWCKGLDRCGGWCDIETMLKNAINNMKPGQSIHLGGNDRIWTTAERSGDGKILRFVRHNRNGFEVFKTTQF